MQRPTRNQVSVTDVENRVGGASIAGKSAAESGPILSDQQVHDLLGEGADNQAKQFARYARSEAAQDGGSETGQSTERQ